MANSHNRHPDNKIDFRTIRKTLNRIIVSGVLDKNPTPVDDAIRVLDGPVSTNNIAKKKRTRSTETTDATDGAKNKTKRAAASPVNDDFEQS